MIRHNYDLGLKKNKKTKKKNKKKYTQKKNTKKKKLQKKKIKKKFLRTDRRTTQNYSSEPHKIKFFFTNEPHHICLFTKGQRRYCACLTFLEPYTRAKKSASDNEDSDSLDLDARHELSGDEEDEAHEVEGDEGQFLEQHSNLSLPNTGNRAATYLELLNEQLPSPGKCKARIKAKKYHSSQLRKVGRANSTVFVRFEFFKTDLESE